MKQKTNRRQFDDFAPTTSGRGSQAPVRSDATKLAGVQCASQLDRHIVRLLSLHPSLRVRFAKQDLSLFSDQAKRELLEDMNDLLGIKG